MSAWTIFCRVLWAGLMLYVILDIILNWHRRP